MKLGGLMIWSIDFDDLHAKCNQRSLELLKTVYETFYDKNTPVQSLDSSQDTVKNENKKKSTKQQVVSIETKTITKTVYESISLEKKIVPTKTEAQPVSILSFYQTLKINFKLKFKIIGKLGIKMIKDIVEFEDFNKLY